MNYQPAVVNISLSLYNLATEAWNKNNCNRWLTELNLYEDILKH